MIMVAWAHLAVFLLMLLGDVRREIWFQTPMKYLCSESSGLLSVLSVSFRKIKKNHTMLISSLLVSKYFLNNLQ